VLGRDSIEAKVGKQHSEAAERVHPLDTNCKCISGKEQFPAWAAVSRKTDPAMGSHHSRSRARWTVRPIATFASVAIEIARTTATSRYVRSPAQLRFLRSQILAPAFL